MLTSLYIAILGRAPDAPGYNHWHSQREQGMSFYDIASSMMHSDEGRDSLPVSLSDQGLVTQLYTHLFDRSPDTDGLNYWVSQLEEGSIDRETLVQALRDSALSDDGEDAALLQARTEAADRYLAEQEAGERDFEPDEAQQTLLQVRGDGSSSDDGNQPSLDDAFGLWWFFDPWWMTGSQPDDAITFSVSSAGGRATVDDTLSGYHQFDNVEPGATYRAEAHRLEDDLDPAMWIFEGLLTAEDFADPTFSTSDSRYIGDGDDEISFPNGPYGEPRIEFDVPESGEFTVVVTNYLSGPDDGGDGRFDYRLEVVEIA